MFNRFPATILVSLFLLVTTCGCRSKQEVEVVTSGGTQAPKDLPPLEVMIVDDSALASAIEREWEAISDQSITVQTIRADELLERRNWSADVMVFPPIWMGELVERRMIRPFLRQGEGSSGDEGTIGPAEIDVSDFFQLTRQYEMKWGKKLYAVSLGSPQFVLLYRRDVFEALKLHPPETWDEYAQLLQALERGREAVAGILQRDDVSALAIEPYGAGWASKMFLARCSAYARNRSQYSCLFSIQSFEPQIDRAPFVRALDDIRQLPSTVRAASSPFEAARMFASGEIAMAITWPEALRALDADVISQLAPVPASVASLPGSRDFFDKNENAWKTRQTEAPHVPLIAPAGRVAAIGRRAPDINRAYEFIIWLSTAETHQRTSTRSPETTVARRSQLKNLAEQLPGPFRPAASTLAQTIVDDQSREIAVTVIRVPGQHRYLNALDDAVRSAFQSEKSSAEILTSVREEWNVITDQLGRESQTNAYANSLGINP